MAFSSPKTISFRVGLSFGLMVVVVLLFHPIQIQGQLTLTPFNRPYTIREDTTAQTELAYVDCKNPSDACLCNLVSPGNVPFDVWRKTQSSGFHVYYVGVNNGQGALDYQIRPTYLLTIECRNSTGGEVQVAIIEIDVLINQAPVFLQSQATIDMDALTTTTGAPVYQVSADDPERDPLIYTIKSTQPPNAVDFFTKGVLVNGEIFLKMDLSTSPVDSILVTVSVTDGRSEDTFDLIVNIINPNTRPEIRNLPATISIPEDQTVPYTIMNLDIYDPDGRPLTTTYTVNPPGETFRFQFDTNSGQLKLVAAVDYETLSQYTITFVTDDGYLKSQNDVLTLNILNVNEPPEFDELAYYCTLDESFAGVSICDINAVITDPDGDPYPTVILTGTNSNRFRYDISTSTITFNVDYDVDQALMPTLVDLELEATDVNGASTKVPVRITVNDVNDNTCDFGGTVLHTFQADQGTQAGTHLGSLIATDNDLTSPNNRVTYEVIRALPPDSSNYISVFADGAILYTGLIPDTNHGKSYSLVVKCKDQGSPQRTSEATVVLTYLTTTTTSTSTTTTPTTTTTTASTTTEEYDIWEEDAFVAVFAALMSLLGLGLIALFITLGRLCTNACALPGGASSDFCCPTQKPKKVEPVDDYFNHDVRTNSAYKDSYWKRGDNYESGTGYDALGSPPSATGGPKRLALPAPRPGHDGLRF